MTKPEPLPPATEAAGAEPQVETPGDRPGPGQAATEAIDPVCGMTVDTATAAEHRGTGPGTVYFCSAGCAAAFDAGPGPGPGPGRAESCGQVV
ncbi:MAG TPA: hypothetical protein VF070_25365 [Streptosporangiaceae bacterium]